MTAVRVSADTPARTHASEVALIGGITSRLPEFISAFITTCEADDWQVGPLAARQHAHRAPRHVQCSHFSTLNDRAVTPSDPDMPPGDPLDESTRRLFQPWNRARHVEQRVLNPTGQGETAPNGRLRTGSRQAPACRVPCRPVGQRGQPPPDDGVGPAKNVFSASSNVSKDCLKTHHRTWHGQVRHAARRGSEDRPEAWHQPAP